MYSRKLLFLVFIAISFQFFTAYQMHKKHNEKTVRDCIVLNKINYIETTKTSFRPYKAFHVKWLDNNREDELKVNNDTFYNTDIGSQTTFIFDGKPDLLLVIMIMISAIITFLEVVICIGLALIYVK